MLNTSRQHQQGKWALRAVFAVALVVVASAALSGIALATVTYATVDGHYGSTPGDGSNTTAYWEDEFELDEGSCTKIEGDDLDNVLDDAWTASFNVDYDHVIVKASSDSGNDNTIFNDVAAGETVFADTNGNNTYDSGHNPDDQSIGHIIVCGPGEAPTATPTNAPTATPSNAPTEAPTATPTNAPTATPTNAPTATPSPTPTLPNTGPTPTPTPTLPDTSGPVSSTATPTDPTGNAFLLLLVGSMAGLVFMFLPRKKEDLPPA